MISIENVGTLHLYDSIPVTLHVSLKENYTIQDDATYHLGLCPVCLFKKEGDKILQGTLIQADLSFSGSKLKENLQKYAERYANYETMLYVGHK